MKNIVVTSGEAYTDIDALACAVAYAELLRLEGKSAEAVLPGALNHSVTSQIRSWNLNIRTRPSADEFDSVLVDTSHVENFAKFVKEGSIVEIYDHHFGHEEYWQAKLGGASHIEFIGACATLIWEEWRKRGFAEKISEVSANLLHIAIVSNTLNFGAQLTSPRDKVAFDELKNFISLPEGWVAAYFSDQEQTAFEDVAKAIRGDTKTITACGLPYPIIVAQMELWDSKKFLDENKDKVKEVLEGMSEGRWIISLPSISEKKNYLYTENPEIKELFMNAFEAVFSGDTGITPKLWLRKEIRKELYKLTTKV